MGIHTLQRMAYQPYYHVLVSDGSNRYAAEENLEPLNRPGFKITHGQVSDRIKHFFSIESVLKLRQEYLRRSLN